MHFYASLSGFIAGFGGKVDRRRLESAGGNKPINPETSAVGHGKAIRARLTASPEAMFPAPFSALIKKGIR